MKILATFVPLASFAFPAHGQQTIDEFLGANPGDRFGTSVAFVGDLNLDGMGDFAVGAPGDDAAGNEAGSVTVYSGADRSVLFHWTGLQAGGRLGTSVAGAGDVDLDGHGDVIAGAPGVSQALVFSGLTGAILYNLAPASGAEFGTAVAAIGFANADAWPDFAVGATAGNGVWAFSGFDGTILWNRAETALELDGVGDVDGDGCDDLLAGDYLHNGRGGRAIVFSGASGNPIREHLGDSIFQEQLGKGVSGLGDINGDGIGDYGYGVPCICFASHYAEVRSGADGGLIHTLTKYTLGWDLAPGGDLNLDGVPDVLVTVPGQLVAFDGATSAELLTFGHGSVVGGGVDADGDGLVDMLGGSGLDDSAGTDAGRVTLYTLGCPDGAASNYCAAAPNSTGVAASMDFQNSTSVSRNNFRLHARDCPPQQFCVFFYGPDEAFAPLGDGFRCVHGPLFRFGVVNTGSTGIPSWQVDFTNPPSPSGQIAAGETWYFSLWFRDPAGGPAGSNLADGLRVAFCP